MCGEGKKDQDPDGRLEESSFITKACGQREKNSQGKPPGVWLEGESGWAVMDIMGGKPRLGLYLGGPAAEARQTSRKAAQKQRRSSSGSRIMGLESASARCRGGTKMESLLPKQQLSSRREKPHNQRDAWWRLVAVFILICRITGGDNETAWTATSTSTTVQALQRRE